MNMPVITGLRVTQEHASVSQIESACQDDVAQRLRTLLESDGVAEAFVLQTCLRVELYVVTEHPENGRKTLTELALGVPDDLVETTNHDASLRHLLRVTAGLESFVVGEDQILGQVRSAVETARAVDAIGPTLETVLSKAIQIGKRARSETAINDGPTSVAGAAVQYVQHDEGLDGQTVLVIGAGEMGSHLVQALSLRGDADLYLANRTRQAAERLATMIDESVTVVAFNAIPTLIPEIDVVISATASRTPILDGVDFVSSGRTVVVDLGQPRDVDPSVAARPAVDVHDLEAIESLTQQAQAARRAATATVEAMIDDAVRDVRDEYKRQQIDDVIAGMYRGAEKRKQAELDEALSKLHHHGGLTDEQRADVEALADALISGLLAAPTAALREAAANDDWQTIETAIDLFDPGMESQYLDDMGASIESMDSPATVRAGSRDEPEGP